MDRTDKLIAGFITMAVLGIVLLQFGIHHGRSLERAEIEEQTVMAIAALLRDDGYDGRLTYENGGYRIVHPRPSFRKIQARAETAEAKR
jgi:hypothetical protein